ncbi:MAG: hypothetical protein A2Z74_01315 [Chloroflexi bacterium RBG_13_46_9]|nr:MAG: hypothetical protein A2Z74_01315 [Chloroflexi bacterium RBG_13_46_9]
MHPGGDKVIIYENTLKKIKEELARKRTMPQAAYFSPSSDIFQPLPEVLELGYSILEFLFSVNIGVVLVTKGHIPDKTMSLLLRYPEKVRVQIGIITLDEDISRVFEPNTADPSVRLEQMKKMVAGGVPTEARLVPILPGITNALEKVEKLLFSVADTGVKRIAVSALFLRPAIVESLRQGVPDKKMLEDLLRFYSNSRRMVVHTERSSIVALPKKTRQVIYTRFSEVAKKYGLETSICGCMNPDISTGTCNIAGTWPRQFGIQPGLFGE